MNRKVKPTLPMIIIAAILFAVAIYFTVADVPFNF